MNTELELKRGPIAWMAKEKSRPIMAGSPKTSTSTGNPIVPPPIGVEPAM